MAPPALPPSSSKPNAKRPLKDNERVPSPEKSAKQMRLDWEYDEQVRMTANFGTGRRFGEVEEEKMEDSDDDDEMNKAIQASLVSHQEDVEREKWEIEGADEQEEDLRSPSPRRQISSTRPQTESKGPEVFRLKHLRSLIIRYNLTQSHTIKPRYPAWMEIPEPKHPWHDYAVSLLVALAGDSEAYQEALTALYSNNKFAFTNAEVALWFLQQIGLPNAHKLRDLDFVLGESVPWPYLAAEEACWWEVFHWLRPVHRLQKMTVSFERWTLDRRNDDMESSRRGNESLSRGTDRYIGVLKLRKGVVRTLLQFRDLEVAEVREGEWVQGKDAKGLAKAMMLPTTGGQSSSGAWVARLERKYE